MKTLYRVTRRTPIDKDEYFYSDLMEALEDIDYSNISCYRTLLLEKITLKWRKIEFEELLNERDTIWNTYNEYCKEENFDAYDYLENYQELVKEIENRSLNFFFYDEDDWKIKTEAEYFYDLIKIYSEVTKTLEFTEKEIKKARENVFFFNDPAYKDKVEYYNILKEFNNF